MIGVGVSFLYSSTAFTSFFKRTIWVFSYSQVPRA
jgi:hypothetical protein